MTFAQRRNPLTTHFSERIPVVKRRVSVLTCYVTQERRAEKVQVHVFFTPARSSRFNARQELQVPTALEAECTPQPNRMFGRYLIPSPEIETGIHGRSVRSLVTTLIATRSEIKVSHSGNYDDNGLAGCDVV